MPLLLNASDVDTLRWVLRCYLADRAAMDSFGDDEGDVRAMFDAAEQDRRAVVALLMRFEAGAEPQSLHTAAPRTRPIPTPAPPRLPVTAGARYPVRTA
jgi:hypothetical protein